MVPTEPAPGGHYLRTVTMTVADWPRFREAFGWLMDIAATVPGCRSIRCYQAADDPTKVCIAEIWDSVEAIGEGYQRLGDAPWEFMRRAGEPDYGVDSLWVLSDAASLTNDCR
jgi:heme-degrading monooxygenase HmoA